jgi:hypothetical protein
VSKVAFATLSLLLATSALADPVATFRGLCMAHLDDVPALRSAAAKQGFGPTDLGPNAFIGMRKKTDESIQVNAFTRAAFECAVTTSDVADPETPRRKFFAALGIDTPKSEVAVKIGRRAYRIKFDTKGGEALVIFR